MSTSSDFSWAAGGGREVFSFEYPAITGSFSHSPAGTPAPWSEANATQRESDAQKQLEKSRLQGERDGELRARNIFEEQLAGERKQVLLALRTFEEERKGYFRRVESEVVQLSLSIARKVLHREAQVDKGLLAGFVRASITQLAEGTAVYLRVHPSVEADWRTALLSGEFKQKPEVVADNAVTPDACILSTQLGTTEISIESQLKEIELGLFDLIAKRP
ncbi:Flagellar biosynthesis/type III secretory pathway protein-like protein [Candidatus Koribacter versatilis Ellin345]|uniref:Flagellar assembly protein FliH n=1 Tax=Koribacter versatilis (strain Ellin345) TaxID=204669 RepID=Q1IR48_KORVE|nr:FliH/SctL family protein [Candidatus Koribacter versatilis]ABF40652.1 Flagellar biosynthesis/type III secretory pathway protein-like protein [Candidatus Koribacter versatilis Ellin345]